MTAAAQTFKVLNDRLTRQVVDQLGDAESGTAVLAEAPPGAGKSSLTCSVAHALVQHDATLTLPIVTQTNEQADDLVASLHHRYPAIRLARLTGGGGPSPAILRLMSPTVLVDGHCDDLQLAGAHIIVGTARKWQYERARLQGTRSPFPFALIDEAYQMRSDALLGVAALFNTLFCVGDPGQIDPFATVDDSLWRGLPYSPTRSAMGTLRAFHPDIPVTQLPISWRLPPSAAGIVSRAFYPYAGFDPGTRQGQRSLTISQRRRGTGGREHDALELAASKGWAYIELPEQVTARNDEEVARTIARTVQAVTSRGVVVTDELHPSGTPMGSNRIAVIAAHNDQVQAARFSLNELGIDPNSLAVSTANKIQGREYDLVIVWHPLAGRRDATAFHLEAGRMCVMLSRHRHACVVVGRAGVGKLLAEFPDSDPIFLDEPEKFPDGWQANYDVLEHLAAYRV